MPRTYDLRLPLLSTAAVIAALLFANVIGNEPGESGGAGPFALSLVLALAIAAFVHGRVIPRTGDPARAARAGLAMSAVGLVTVAAFWTGLPFVLGPAGAALGAAGRKSTDSGTRRLALAAIVVGALAAIVASVGILLDELG